MRRILGYIEGRPQWSENVPASPGSSKIGGTIHFGAPGPNDKDAQKRRDALARVSETPDNGGASQPRPEVSPVSVPR